MRMNEGTPMDGLLPRKSIYQWMMTGGTYILGNPKKILEIQTKVEVPWPDMFINGYRKSYKSIYHLSENLALNRNY